MVGASLEATHVQTPKYCATATSTRPAVKRSQTLGTQKQLRDVIVLFDPKYLRVPAQHSSSASTIEFK